MTITINGTTGIAGVDGSASVPAVQGNDTNTGMFFPTADTIAFAEGGVESMRLDSNGNVGIGTSSPGVRFQINHDQAALSYFDYYNTTNGGGVVWRQIVRNIANTGTTSVDIAKLNGGAFLINNNDTNSANYTAFGVGGSERARIDSSGNLAVGSSSNPPSARIFANVTSNQNAIAAYGNSTSMTHFLVSTTISNAGGSDAFGAYDASGIAARITTNGFYQSRPNSYGGTSDIKLKENVVDATPKLSDIMSVRIRNYNYKDEPGVKQIGVIAQELEQVFPGLVYETTDRDAEGNDLGTTTKSVKYSVFVPMLIKAMQEQQAIIEQLKADVAALKGTA